MLTLSFDLLIRWYSVAIPLTEVYIQFLLFLRADGNLENAYKYLCNVNVISVEKQEAVNSLQKELTDVQEHLDLAEQVNLINVIFWLYLEGLQTIG